MTRRRIGIAMAALGVLLFVSCGTNKPKEKEAGPAPAEYKVRLKTTKGDVLVLVHRDWAPLGADHFYELVKMGFYDGDRFFRAIRGFVVQFGVNGDPKLNKDWSEISIKDDPPKVSNKVGTLTYATSGPNTRSTQIFINLGNNSRLDSKGFSPFGEVIQGMENIENLYFAYGDGPPFGSGPSQESLAEIGNDYLDHRFPKLDSIKKATIE